MPSVKDVYRTLGQLRQSILVPYTALLIAMAAMLIFIGFFSSRLDTYSEQSARHLFNSVLANELTGLGKLVKDYAYWHETVDNLISRQDPIWIASNIQESLTNSFGVTRVIATDLNGHAVISIKEGEVSNEVPTDIAGPEISLLFKRALDTNMLEPEVSSGIVWIDQQLFLAAVCAITPDIDINGLDPSAAYGLLLFARPFDRDLLDKWQHDFQLNNLMLHNKPYDLDDHQIAIEIKSPLNRWVATIGLDAEHPGETFLKDALPWSLAFVALAFFISTILIRRVYRCSGMVNSALNELNDGREELRLSQQQLANVINGADLGYWDWDYQSGKHQVNDRWLEILGLSRSDIKNDVSDWEDRIHPDDRERMIATVAKYIESGKSYSEDFRMKHKDGHWVWIQGSGAVVEYEPGTRNARRLCGTHQDISKRKEVEAWLERQATHDFLTGLHNRVELERHLTKELDRSKRYDHNLSLLVIDIDHFKKINDSFGHQAGDQVLVNIATFLTEKIRHIDFIARYGGEEFVVIMPETGMGKSMELAERLREALERMSFNYHSNDISLTISIGISTYPQNGNDLESLMKKADAALYRAKHGGRNRVCHAAEQ